jgi:hypothetical protein
VLPSSGRVTNMIPENLILTYGGGGGERQSWAIAHHVTLKYVYLDYSSPFAAERRSVQISIMKQHCFVQLTFCIANWPNKMVK